MDSFSSTSAPPNLDNSPPITSLQMTQSVADRVVRALRHRLLLLHRSESEFYVLGATGNVYTVTLSLSPSCTCPDRVSPCKHILFILIRVLGVSLNDTCLRRRTLRPCQLSRLVRTPTSPESLARASIRETFHRMFLQSPNWQSCNNASGGMINVGQIENGITTTTSTCPICLDEMRHTQKIVACGTCRNGIHEECLLAWKRSNRRRSTTCVICRARWRNRVDQNTLYFNLSAYVIIEEDNDHVPQPNNSMCCD